MIIQAHAKINVALNILNKREDGYHTLDMVMLPLDLHDSIDISLLPADFDTFITCDDVSLETGEYNLCTIALKAMRERYQFKQEFRIHIHKSIPMAAGLGGGSSDAAAVMHAICTLLKIHPDPVEINEIARTIGSDVPFFYEGKAARVSGVGEIVKPIQVAKRYYALIVKPGNGLSTRTVYSQYDLMEKEAVDVDAVVSALAIGDDDKLASSMAKKKKKPAFFLLPEIKKVKESLIK
ncbi:MAG: 4-(cytidine 5'-diphospho)-2-C-methyl-D-erythritol kinase, partial [Firmicutes bacterium]|nr:4-(cytidine 5'-diphospho)-2-C-methyl-D-erythritol kinase [Bacillota bacterium]